MNYFFQFNGIPRKNASGATIYDLGYSEEDLPDLDESGELNENSGLLDSDTNALSYYTCLDNGHGATAADVIDNESSNLMIEFQMNGSPIDWNCDGVISNSANTNVNGENKDAFDVAGGNLGKLEGRTDWDKLVLKIGCADYGLKDNFNANDVIYISEEYDNCPEHDDIRASLQGSDDRIPPDIPYGEVCDGTDNDKDGQIDEGCPDSDNDRIVDAIDNCPGVANPDQIDSNHDFFGDACMNKVQQKPQEGKSKPLPQNSVELQNDFEPADSASSGQEPEQPMHICGPVFALLAVGLGVYYN